MFYFNSHGEDTRNLLFIRFNLLKICIAGPIRFLYHNHQLLIFYCSSGKLGDVCILSAKVSNERYVSQIPLPSFGRDNPNSFLFSSRQYLGGLPPFVVASVDDVEDVSKLEWQAPARQTAVFWRVIVEEGPVESKREVLN